MYSFPRSCAEHVAGMFADLAHDEFGPQQADSIHVAGGDSFREVGLGQVDINFGFGLEVFPDQRPGR